MEFKGSSQSTNNRVSQPHPPAPRPVTEGSSLKMVTRDSGNKKMMLIGGIVVAVLVLGGVGWWCWQRFMSPDGVKTGQYQAVFLTNGQVYFCHLSNITSQYVDCDGIYYLQVQQDSSTVQPADNKTTNQSPQVSLAKLGNELHGPEDHMAINRDQVLFWENLKDSGKVVQAIKANQK